MKQKLTITIDRDLKQAIVEKAMNEGRSLSNMVNRLLLEKIFKDEMKGEK